MNLLYLLSIWILMIYYYADLTRFLIYNIVSDRAVMNK
jgi:hypothetical protein